jgi:hypothetical protein
MKPGAKGGSVVDSSKKRGGGVDISRCGVVRGGKLR